MPVTEALHALVRELQRQARASRQRRLVLLAGEADWCRAMAKRCLALLPGCATLWIGSAAADGLPGLALEQGLRVMGGEHELLVLDAHEGFDPDVFGAASGAVVGGGLLFLSAHHWQTGPRFLIRRMPASASFPMPLPVCRDVFWNAWPVCCRPRQGW